MSDSSEAADLVRRLNAGLNAGSISRRTVLRGMVFGGAMVAGGGLLGACGASGSKAKGSGATPKDISASDKAVNWSNWPLYIDVDDDTKKRPTLDAFTEKTGIKVNYTEDINDNDEFFGKIRPQLAAGKSTGRDLIVLTDWMAGRMIRLGYLQKLDKSKIPNSSNLRAALKSPGFDPNRDYTLPWQTGMTGIAYNPKETGGKKITSIDQLLTDGDLKGRVTVLTELRDTMGLVLAAQGADPAKFAEADYSKAIDTLKKAVSDGQIRQFTGNDYAQGLAAGNIAACVAWSGDVVQLQADNPGIEFVIPDSGAMLWSDNLMIPNGADHQGNAEALVNYYYDPTVAATVEDYVNYICPVQGADKAMESIDKDIVSNPLVFPSDADLAKTHIFMDLDPDEEKKYTDMFTAVTGA